MRFDGTTCHPIGVDQGFHGIQVRAITEQCGRLLISHRLPLEIVQIICYDDPWFQVIYNDKLTAWYDDITTIMATGQNQLLYGRNSVNF